MRIAAASSSLRMTVGSFCVLYLAFALLAQANLWVQAGDGRPPAPEAVLWKYAGRPDSSRLHTVLDPMLPEDHPLNMSLYLGEGDVAAERKKILDWVDAGAPEEGFEAIAPIFRDEARCAQCHAPDGVMESVPLDSFEAVKPLAAPDRGMALPRLLISAHNHLFAFAVAALVLSLLLCYSRWGGWLRFGLILAAFLGPLLDVGGWLLTHSFGAPFHWFVMAGGALFGGATTAMAGLVLLDALRIRTGRTEAEAGADAPA